MDFVIQLAPSLISGIVVAVVASYVTVRLSLKRFYSERWWERKAQAYSEIVEALYDVQNSVELQLEAVERGLAYEDEYSKQLQERSVEGHRSIYKSAGIGAFIISDEASELLSQVRSEIETIWGQYEDYTDEMGLDYAYGREKTLVKDALSRMREIAKDDLKVRGM